MSLAGTNKGRMALLLVFGAYLAYWIVGNREMLFDPMLQTDDVRQHLIAFHRYADNPSMAEDPIVREVFYFVTPGVHLLYRIIVPVTSVPVASKIVQGICFLVVMLSVCLAARGTGAALPGAVLLVFLLLRTPGLADTMVGGLQRSFAMPSMVLWTLGGLASSPAIRVAAILFAAVTYPVAMLLMLAAEPLLVLAGIEWNDRKLRVEQLKNGCIRYAAVVAGCLLLLTPYLLAKRPAGSTYNLAQAQVDPAFQKGGRSEVLPFSKRPLWEMARRLVAPVTPSGHMLFRSLAKPFKNDWFVAALAIGILAAVVLGAAGNIFPWPRVGLSLMLVSAGLYILARMFAFHLYLPDRYLQMGMRLAGIALIAETVPRLKCRWLPLSKEWLASVALIAALVLGGDGVKQRLGLRIDGRRNHALLEFFSNSPTNTRIACHPNDADDIPFWSGRPTTGGPETVQLFAVDSYQRQKAMIEDVLRAMYATDWNTVITFCERRRVTHLMLRPERYGPDFRKHARMFQPFGAYIEDLLASVDHKDLVLRKVLTSDAVVFRDKSFVVIEVKDLPRLAAAE